MKAPLCGVIDVGSNGIRIGVADLRRQCTPKYVFTAREQVRLGVDTFTKGKISRRLERRLLKVFRKFRKIFDKYKVKTVKAVATSALRDSSNKKEILNRIFAETDIPLTTIDGHEEARLIHLAAKHLLDLKKYTVMMDIGGGSVEVIFSKSGKVKYLASLKLGSVRMLKKVGVKATPDEYLQFIQAQFKKLPRRSEFLGKGNNRLGIGTGGNMRRLGKLRKILFKKSNTEIVTLNELENTRDILFSMSYRKRVNKLRMTPDRADVILPSVVLAIEFMKHYNFEKLFLPEISLKDGVLIDLCKRHGLSFRN